MNDEFSELENELRGLRPLRPSPQLEQRIALALAVRTTESPNPTGSRPVVPRWMAACGWSLAASAAALLIVLAFRPLETVPTRRAARQESARSNAAAVRQPQGVGSFDELIGGATILYEARDEGVVLTDAQRPARRMRYRALDTVAWRNSRTGAQMEVSYPREEVFLTPIVLH